MNTDRLNRWLTLAANFGVLVTLILLVFEIRQNTDTLQAQMAQARVDNRLEYFRAAMHSDYWPALEVKRSTASSTEDWVTSLTADEYQRARAELLYEINALATQFYQYKNGYLDEEIFETAVEGQAVRTVQKMPYFGRLGFSDSEFLRYLNSVARKHELPEYELGTQ